METFLIVARIGLALIFALAGLAKLIDRRGTRAAVVEFGVPRGLAPIAGFALPALELLTCALLIPQVTARAGAALALALLLVFLAAIGRALREGRAPDCHCFGQVHSEPTGRETVVRNVLLVVLALAIIVDPGPALPTWADQADGDAGLAAVSLLLALGLALATSSLSGSNRRLRQSPGGAGGHVLETPVSVGEKLPDVPLRTLEGGSLNMRDAVSGSDRSVLVFTSATCGPCHAMLPELARWKRQLHGRLDVQIVAAGDAEANRLLAEEHHVQILLDPEGRGLSALRLPGTPIAVEVDGSGAIATPAVPGQIGIESLIRSALKRRPAESATLPVHHVGGGRGS